MLNVAIGVTFYFLLISIVAMAATEVVELMWKQRGTLLEQGVRSLLQDGSGNGLAKAFYHHPLIRPLYARPGAPTAPPPEATDAASPNLAHKPDYIPSRDFALAVLDLLGLTKAPDQVPPASLAQRLDDATAEVIEAASGQDGLTLTDAEVQAIQRALRPLLADVGADLDQARLHIEAWYNSAMDRVSGWYKRHAQKVALVTGCVLALFLNADSIFVIKSLSENDGLRTALVAAAEAYVQEAAESATTPDGHGAADSTASDSTAALPVRTDSSAADSDQAHYEEAVRRYEESVQQLATLGLPLGWERGNPSAMWPRRLTVTEDDAATAYADSLERGLLPADASVKTFTHRLREARPGAVPSLWDSMTWWGMKLLGLFLTGLAVSLGAPFWFDVLNKLMVVRSTVKPHEKSPEEGSEDRRPAPGWDSIIPMMHTQAAILARTAVAAPPATGGASPMGSVPDGLSQGGSPPASAEAPDGAPPEDAG